MTNTFFEEIVIYIRKNLKKGYTKDSLRVALINQGYSRLQIEKAIKRVDLDLASEAPILKTKPIITHQIIPVKKIRIKTDREKNSFFGNLFDFL